MMSTHWYLAQRRYSESELYVHSNTTQPDPECYSPGLGLSGNRNNPATNSAGKVSDRHQKIYTAAKIQSHPTIRLSRNGMIIIALLSGGDYDKVSPLKIPRCLCQTYFSGCERHWNHGSVCPRSPWLW